MTEKSSYVQILKSSSIMGGAAVINLLLGMVRVKFAAVLIGIVGVGLNASFGALHGLISSLAGLGIHSSAVREIAAAVGKCDEQAIGRTALTLRRICWITGLVGMMVTILLSPLLSQLTFGNQDFALDIAALGVVILFGNLSGGQMALIQGMRRIGDIARANIIGAVFGAVAAIGFYATLGLRGIVPTLVVGSACQLLLSWRFARELSVPKIALTLRQTFAEGSDMVCLGLVFMVNGLMVSVVSYATIALITQFEGIQAVGIYSAAFALSGMFVGFVLGAMGADYYPRLTAVAHDHAAMNRMVNEQTEIGLLLALPGLLGTLAFAPWIIGIFYSSEFLPAVELLQWFVLGCLGRVISWPLGYVMLALGKGRWYLFTESTFNIFQFILVFFGLLIFGIEGVGIGFFLMYVAHTLAMYLLDRRLIGYKVSAACMKISCVAFLVLATTFIASRFLSQWPATMIGMTLTTAISLYSLRGLVQRIGLEHRVFRVIKKVPGFKALCGAQ